LQAGQSITHDIASGHGAWFQLIKGSVEVEGTTFQPGDAFSTDDTGTLAITARDNVEGLLFDLV